MIHYKCDILEAKLLVTKHVLLPQILSQHSKLWESGFPALSSATGYNENL
jgi:hypothetical protein